MQNGVCVGCIISKDNKILGQGWYEYYGAPHAEIKAIESIKEKYKKKEEPEKKKVVRRPSLRETQAMQARNRGGY